MTRMIHNQMTQRSCLSYWRLSSLSKRRKIDGQSTPESHSRHVRLLATARLTSTSSEISRHLTVRIISLSRGRTPHTKHMATLHNTKTLAWIDRRNSMSLVTFKTSTLRTWQLLKKINHRSSQVGKILRLSGLHFLRLLLLWVSDMYW